MKARILGFELQCGKGITIDEFLRAIEAKNGQQEGNRVFAVAKRGDLWTGFLLTIKDEKSFAKIKQERGSFKIVPQHLEEGASMVDFNFFVLHEITARGLYQHYHQSPSFATCAYLLKQKYNFLKKSKVDAALEAQPSATQPEQNKIIKQFARSLSFSILVRKDSLKERIESWERVKALEAEYTTLDFANDPLAPLSKVAKRRQARFTFGKSNMDIIKSKVANVLSKGSFKTWRVEGVDPDGHEQICKAMNDYDTFAEFEHSAIVDTLTIDSNDLVKSLENAYVLKEMVKLAEGRLKLMLSAPAAP